MAEGKNRKEEASEMKRYVRGQIGRRYIDATLVNISCVGGNVYLNGVVKSLRAHPEVNLREELETIAKLLRGKNGIRDVVWDVNLRS